MENPLVKLRNRKQQQQGGFTLIEMAIVLIIIGLIIGAVLKGQDLITNARAKRVANFVRQAEVAVWTHMDRVGRFPGDSDQDGDPTDDNFYTDITNAGIENFEEQLTLGSTTFNVGVDMFDPGAGIDPVPVLCVVTDGGDLSENEALYLQMVDVSIDGEADSNGGNGDDKVFGMSACAAVDTNGIVACGNGMQATWVTGAVEGLCYMFDTGSF